MVVTWARRKRFYQSKKKWPPIERPSLRRKSVPLVAGPENNTAICIFFKGATSAAFMIVCDESGRLAEKERGRPIARERPLPVPQLPHVTPIEICEIR